MRGRQRRSFRSHMKPLFPIGRVCSFAILSVGLAALFSGCTTGPMNISNVHYYAVKYNGDTNYYRLTLTANTSLGIAGYREGWFPATAVDKLFGEVSENSSQSALVTKEAIRADYDNAVKQATETYLKVAVDPDSTDAQLAKAYATRQRVVLYPNVNTLVGKPPFEQSGEIAYSSDRGVAVPHSDEKLVIVLSSDPDAVVGAIASLAEDEKTAVTINNLGLLVDQRGRVDRATAGARDDVQKQQMYAVWKTIDEQQKQLRPTAAVTRSVPELQSLLRTQIMALRTTFDLAAP
jgi:hypothetical protein